MQRARLALLFLCILSVFSTTNAAENSCSPDRVDSKALVTKVYDGDTLRLENGTKLRLIGINTPELYPDPKQGAEQARAELDQLLKKHHYQIKIRLDREQTDRYGRTLAHVFLNDGTNVTAWLLRNGLGHWVAVRKNLSYLSCYLEAEQNARIKHLNLWGRLPDNFVRAEDLNLETTGFYILTGELTRVFETDTSVWLELMPRLRLRLDKQNYGNFSSHDYVQEIGGTLMTRGWVYTSHGKLTMKISHPSLIQFEPNLSDRK